MDQEIASQIIGLGGTTDFSLMQLFLRADFVVKISNHNSYRCFNLFLGTNF